MTSPIDRSCSFCAAEPGVPCNRPRGSRDGFHAARLNPAVRGASFSNSKNNVASRERGSRKGAAKKKAMARKPRPTKGRVFSVWWYVAAGCSLYAKPGVELHPTNARDRAKTINALEAKRWVGATLLSSAEVREARRYMRERHPKERVRVVRVTVRVRG